jgi:hypothetical protein
MSERNDKLGITEDDMKAELVSHDMVTLEKLSKEDYPEFERIVSKLIVGRYNEMIDTDPKDLENTYAELVGEGDYQCGSCQKWFDHPDDGDDCPYCHSDLVD